MRPESPCSRIARPLAVGGLLVLATLVASAGPAPAQGHVPADPEAFMRWCTMSMGNESVPMATGGGMSMPGGAMPMHAGAHLQTACMMATMMPPSSATGGEPIDRERAYLRMMVFHHEGAIALARLAQEKATHPELVELAGNVTRGQQAEIDTLRGWLEQWHNETVPPLGDTPMGAATDEQLAGLANLSGEAFDRALLDAMIRHHLMAVHMSDFALDFAAHPEAHDFAAGVIRTQEAEIQQMRAWRAEWFGGPMPPTASAAPTPGGESNASPQEAQEPAAEPQGGPRPVPAPGPTALIATLAAAALTGLAGRRRGGKSRP